MTGAGRLILMCSCSLVFGPPAFGGAAAGEAKPPGEEKKLETLSLEEILNISIVTAAKHAQKVGDAPSTVSVITEEQIRKSGKTTLADLLKGIVGMDVSYSSQRKFAVAARGLSGGTFSKRILFLVDGRPINVPSSGEAYTGYPVALNDIKQIEIIRGPGSSLYGGNAFVGVVNIILKRPEDYKAKAVDALVSYGAYNRVNGAVGVGKKVGDFGFTLSANYLKSNEDGIWKKWYNDAAIPDYFKGYDLKGRIEYKDLTLEGGYNHLKMPVSEKGQYTSATSYMRYEQDHLGFTQGQWTPKLSKNVTLNAKAYYNGFQMDTFDLYNAAGQIKDTKGNVQRTYAAGDRRWGKTPSDEKSWGGGLQVDWTPLASTRLMVGVDHLRQSINQQNLKSTDGTPDPALDYYTDKSLDATGVFVQAEQTIQEKLLLTAGVRYDKYSAFKRNVSPRLSALYKFDANGTLRASYGEAFRIPSLAEYYYSLYYYAKDKLNWQLVPEKIHTYELAAGYTFPKAKLSLEGTFFRNEVPNMILNTADRIDDQYPFQYFYYNFYKRVVSQGIELEAEKSFGAHFLARANYTYQRAKDADGNPMVEAPDHKFNLDATTTWGRFTGNATLAYVGPRYDQYYYTRYIARDKQQMEHASSKVGSYAVLDMRLGLRLTDNFNLEVAGVNLLDQKFYDKGHNGKYDVGYLTYSATTKLYTTSLPTNSYLNRDYLNPGRAVRVELRATF